jgi:predicted membrane-bound spermidine synthase
MALAMSKDVQASSFTIAGIFLITLATLMDEILLTRVFSVTLWYHFGFAAISLAMFGMTIGALRVYQSPGIFVPSRAKSAMAKSALWFAITAVVSVIAHLTVPLSSQRIAAVAWLSMTYALFSVPFYFSGICVCVALTKFPKSAGIIYAADLLGAGAGCITLIAVLRVCEDAPTALLVVGVIGCVSSLALATDGKLSSLQCAASIVGTALLVLGFFTAYRAAKQNQIVRVTWAKGQAEAKPLYEKWNSFSRIAVDGDPSTPTTVITEGVSQTYPPDRTAFQLHLRIDGGAETTITSWSKPEDIEYLKYDVKNIVHHLRSHGSVLIIGAGGGRDVLSALLMGQRSVRAVEINQQILSTVNSEFGEFSKHLDENPKITFVNDEARSYIARTHERFDVIEASFIDTWAANSAGALTLSENALYTTDAWALFLNRLSPQGIISFSRWYSPQFPGETYRLVSLAAAALHLQGIVRPREHIMLVSNLRSDFFRGQRGAATILVAQRPFSNQEVDTVEMLAREMKFNVLLSPRAAVDTIFSSLANCQLKTKEIESLKLNLSAPNDDRPFFFYMKPLRFVFQNTPRNQMLSHELEAGEIVVSLFLMVVLLSAFFVFVPLFRNLETATLRRSATHLLFFGAIGTGFMLIEVSQMQRLIIFLGHPTYSLSVVLSTLLVSSGLGSYASRGIFNLRRRGSGVMILLLISLLAFRLLNVKVAVAFASSTTQTRVLLTILMLAPVGFFMGMPFPLGLKLSGGELERLMPAFWGINGAASICASVLAVLIATNIGVSATFWLGFVSYVVALFAYLRLAHTHDFQNDLQKCVADSPSVVLSFN